MEPEEIIQTVLDRLREDIDFDPRFYAGYMLSLSEDINKIHIKVVSMCEVYREFPPKQAFSVKTGCFSVEKVDSEGK